jgi:predicted NUDIX family NTP pyrophosphohydrolase
MRRIAYDEGYCQATNMPKQSAGLLIYRRRDNRVEVFLVHPGGPFWQNKDHGAWSIPKGEFRSCDDPLDVAVRELREETGMTVHGEFVPLTPIRQRGGKTVHAWLVAGDFDEADVKSNSFSIEWPPRSGKMQEFPEIDRAGWFTWEVARQKILESQRPLLDEAEARVEGNSARQN